MLRARARARVQPKPNRRAVDEKGIALITDTINRQNF